MAQLLENSPLAVIEWDSDFRVSRWSRSAERLFGWKAEEVLGKHVNEWQFVFADDVDAVALEEPVTCEDVERLVQSRVVSGGMVLKLEAARRALEGGVREVRIVGGSSPDALLRASRSSDNPGGDADAVPGTRVLREPLAATQTALSAA